MSASFQQIFERALAAQPATKKWDFECGTELDAALERLLLAFDGDATRPSAATLIPVFADYHAYRQRAAQEQTRRTRATLNTRTPWATVRRRPKVVVGSEQDAISPLGRHVE